MIDLEEYKTFESKIVHAVGNKVCDNNEHKRSFALAIYTNIIFVFTESSRPKEFNDKLETLINDTTNLIQALETFSSSFSEMGATRTKMMIPLTLFRDEFQKGKQSVEEMNDFLDKLICKLNSTSFYQLKRGKDISYEQAIADFIATNYYEYFKNKPCTAKQTKKDVNGVTVFTTSPYDRVCEIIEAYWNKEIPISTRVKATKKFDRLV